MEYIDLVRIRLALLEVPDLLPTAAEACDRAFDLLLSPDMVQDVVEVLRERGVTREIWVATKVRGIEETLEKLAREGEKEGGP